MARFVEVAIEGAGLAPMRPARNDCGFSSCKSMDLT